MAQLLLISPDADARLVIEPTVYAEGHAIQMVETAGEAIDLLGEQRFDVVLCETDLPDVSGRVLMRHIREVYGIPTIAIGDHSQFGHHWLSRRPREMQKPVNAQEVVRIVQRYA